MNTTLIMLGMILLFGTWVFSSIYFPNDVIMALMLLISWLSGLYMGLGVND